MFFIIIGVVADILAIVAWCIVIAAAMTDIRECKRRTDIMKGLKFMDDYLTKKEASTKQEET